MMCACVYYSCRYYKLPISFKEFIDITNIKAGLVKKGYSTLVRTLNLRALPSDPSIFVSRYINELKLSISIEKRVLNILQKVPTTFINGKDPKSSIGAIIYFVSKKVHKKILQKDLARITGSCEVSIRYKYRELEKML